MDLCRSITVCTSPALEIPTSLNAMPFKIKERQGHNMWIFSLNIDHIFEK
jgi:hypothetical protein